MENTIEIAKEIAAKYWTMPNMSRYNAIECAKYESKAIIDVLEDLKQNIDDNEVPYINLKIEIYNQIITELKNL